MDCTQKPVLSKGCRLRESTGDVCVMIPEGILKLSPGGLRVLKLCDGSKNISTLIAELKSQHAKEDAHKIETETMAFLERLAAKRVLTFV